MAESKIVKCPICGKEVDLSDVEKATAHMTKDVAHKKHMQEANVDMMMMDQFIDSGIIRRI